MIYGGLFDTENKLVKIKQLESIMAAPNFWDDNKKSEMVINELNSLKRIVDEIVSAKNKIETNREFLEELKQNNDNELINLITNDVKLIQDNLNDLNIEILLSGPYDKYNAILELHSGAGGTEACDWVEMLYRMYNRWCNKKGYKFEVMDIQYGDEACIKSVSVLVKGVNVYGYLKCEKGVHRLVRISPFDSNARRHTSFASVDVTPLFENEDIDIKINDQDIRIDVYRSSGCGGQGVNTTDSAVRITHLPTKIVVTCQNERSQIQNKEKAMEVLRNKLYQIELEKKNEQLKNIKGEISNIDFGSQIRSYVMHPYSLVKDNRTNTETSNVSKVLDGDIDIFINDVLKKGF